jgi:hypothetical protein
MAGARTWGENKRSWTRTPPSLSLAVLDNSQVLPRLRRSTPRRVRLPCRLLLLRLESAIYAWRPGQLPIGQTAKARSGYRVQSLRKGRDRQCRTNPTHAVNAGLVRIAPLIYTAVGMKKCALRRTRELPVSPRWLRPAGSDCRFHWRSWSARFAVLQCDQTTVLAAHRIMCREEVGQSYQGQVRFALRVRLQHGNDFDCSGGAFSARRRGLGIFALAALTGRRVSTHTCCSILLRDA